MPWYCYIIRCLNNKLYVGITDNLDVRFLKHKKGKGAKYTKKFKPLKIVWHQKFTNQKLARQKEIQIKGWNRLKKEKLIAGFLR